MKPLATGEWASARTGKLAVQFIPFLRIRSISQETLSIPKYSRMAVSERGYRLHRPMVRGEREGEREEKRGNRVNLLEMRI